MPSDKEYWKKKYMATWDASAKREDRLAQILTQKTGRAVLPVGLGAGSTAFIHGDAEDNRHTKGDADLTVEDTDIFIEVTGPLADTVDADQPLWFRPDKIENAILHQQDHDTFFAHHLPKTDLWRIIHIDRAFMDAYQRGEYKKITVTIRGAKETYCEIPPDHPHTDINGLAQYIAERLSCFACPFCGGHLVKRQATKGYYAGRYFYGCSNYPQCRFIRNAEQNNE